MKQFLPVATASLFSFSDRQAERTEGCDYFSSQRLPNPVGTAEGGDYAVDAERKAVTVGRTGDGAPTSAIFREGIGCVVLEPGQYLDKSDSLPILSLKPPAGDPATITWPNGDLLVTACIPDGLNLERECNAI